MTGGCPTILFVLGMFRSGTSALTRVLSLSGATLPPAMMGAGHGNRGGFWEPRKAVFLNDRILHSLGSAPTDPRVHDHKLRVEDMSAVRNYLLELPSAPLIVIKDLQITPISDLWFAAAGLAGYDIATVICVRHPQEVIDSVEKVSIRQQHVLSTALWLKYTLLAERLTRGMPRVFVDYANVLQNWQHEVKRIATILPTELYPDTEAVDGFLSPEDRHEIAAAECPAPFGMGWPGMVYRQLHRAACDDEFDQTVLDKVLPNIAAPPAPSVPHSTASIASRLFTAVFPAQWHAWRSRRSPC